MYKCNNCGKVCLSSEARTHEKQCFLNRLRNIHRHLNYEQQQPRSILDHRHDQNSNTQIRQEQQQPSEELFDEHYDDSHYDVGDLMSDIQENSDLKTSLSPPPSSSSPTTSSSSPTTSSSSSAASFSSSSATSSSSSTASSSSSTTSSSSTSPSPALQKEIHVHIPAHKPMDFTTQKSVNFFVLTRELNIGKSKTDAIIDWINTFIADPEFGKDFLRYFLCGAHIPQRSLCICGGIINKYVDDHVGDQIVLERKPLLSQHVSKTLSQEISVVKPVQYDVCPGCSMYTDDSLDKCPNCNKPRFKVSANGKITSLETTYQLPLSQHLASYLQSPALRYLMGYRWRRSVETTMKDIFDGSTYLSIREQLFQQPEDIAIALFTDGFNVFKKRSYTVTLVMATILNLLPEERFLQPLLSELMILQDSGMVVHTPDGEFKSKVHLLVTGGDIPAIGELIGNSHTGAYGCRICLVKGQRIGKGGMFFPPTKKAPHTRQVSSFITGDAEHHLKKETPFAMLKTFKGPMFFVIDEMHMLGHNIGMQVWDAIRGKKFGRNNPLMLIKLFIENTVDMQQQPGYARAVDWITFMVYIVPTYVIEQLDKQQQECKKKKKKNKRVLEQAKLALLALSKAYKLILEFEITTQDIQLIESCIQTWHTFLNNHMPKNIFTINEHYLGHVPDCIKQYGPPRMYSSRPTERMIGILKPKINSRSKPVANASNVIKDMTATAQFFRHCASNDLLVNQQPLVQDQLSESGNIMLSGMITVAIEDEVNATATLKRLQQKTTHDFNNEYDLKSLLTEYYSRHGIDYSNLDATIYTGKQTIVCGHDFSGLNVFAKLTLPVDARARRGLTSENALRWGHLFGTILLTFCHVHREKRRIFCVLSLRMDTTGAPIINIPVGFHERSCLYVTDVSHLDCVAMELPSLHVDNKSYYIYPEMRKHVYFDTSRIWC
ncbi:hypothetical protein INT45_014317 [Circinella minor]|uniref:Uncharacterized protein n=1 Tax=Circinella minor TaxID=1195481 RepID=A0A8H7V7R8_9FUNG|nr:hypothetical protein INT45_014317 [Circinella minor]